MSSTSEKGQRTHGTTRASRLWSIEETADFLGVPETTLYQWRHKRTGPPSHRVGRHVRYFPEAVQAWVRSQP
ncbi:AlpA family transcriptional regulator [Nocardiopsis sp. TNDT3]|jgi:excisionase family DNA binding protein|uniref:helix-turn-helix transcriptional regulator n=1 Tax=Nocardiopsis sp. TNDT3 TaxID=2249354 RepID=UPI000E3B88EC|nr:helix-turn-helix domain-containing protein [Nocardiopsis sp. TNDT3]